MKIKYVIHPGYVISENDDDRHYIGFNQLVQLYGVNRAECIDARYHGLEGYSEEFLNSLEHLFPERHGRYRRRDG